MIGDSEDDDEGGGGMLQPVYQGSYSPRRR